MRRNGSGHRWPPRRLHGAAASRMIAAALTQASSAARAAAGPWKTPGKASVSVTRAVVPSAVVPSSVETAGSSFCWRSWAAAFDGEGKAVEVRGGVEPRRKAPFARDCVSHSDAAVIAGAVGIVGDYAGPAPHEEALELAVARTEATHAERSTANGAAGIRQVDVRAVLRRGSVQ